MTDYTQAAAKKCADLANAETGVRGLSQAYFLDEPSHLAAAFRREIERINARDREVLALLEILGATGPRSTSALDEARSKLRTDLLPDPAPTLLEEFMVAHPLRHSEPFDAGVKAALDWIAKREGKEI